jgi:hypothetical protein
MADLRTALEEAFNRDETVEEKLRATEEVHEETPMEVAEEVAEEAPEEVVEEKPVQRPTTWKKNILIFGIS